MIILGTIESVVFRNDENNYTVVDIDCKGELICAVGNFPSANIGERVELVGDYIQNVKYGQQFSVKSVQMLPPDSTEGIKKYLSSGLIKGVGEATANAIVNKFGLDTLDIMEYNPAKLAEVRGVSKNKATLIASAFLDIKKMQKAVMFLQKYNISTNLAVKIYEHYGLKTEELVSENPYRLLEDVDGVGFITADKIARNMGINEDSPFRMRAGVLYCLTETADRNGNTYLPKNELFSSLAELLRIDIENHKEIIEDVLNKLMLDNGVKIFEYKKQIVIMYSKFYNIERAVAQKLNLIKSLSQPIHADLKADIDEYERVNKIKLHKDQRTAIELATEEGVSVITGGPGTGKTTIIKCIIQILSSRGKKVMLLAPTGRAAKRLSESAQVEASTIHRALGMDYRNNSNMFAYNEFNKLPVDAVVVDEVSMVDVQLMNYLLKALNSDTKLILVGDKNQLPSVGAGNVLDDILKSEIIPYVSLTHIYRQSENSFIVLNAHAINKGQMPILENSGSDFFFENKSDLQETMRTIVDLVVTRLPQYLNISSSKVQVLTGLKMGSCGANNLNSQLQNYLNPPTLSKPEIEYDKTIYRLNDKVMQIANNYQREWQKILSNGTIENGTGVFNGDIGIIKAINRQTGEITVKFEDDRVSVYPKNELNQLILSYAITVHKSQGSEFDAVVMPVIAGTNLIFTRNLLYTAVTRAKRLVMLVGTKYNIKRMVDNNYTATRYSMLKQFLIEQQKNVAELYS
ncbi:MAG: ATP-dependent RecD-like DNA helicase [Clostridia bacterium]|nr:ATP-dependent RecD-like DNA helicase [Clostridia bacterium]